MSRGPVTVTLTGREALLLLANVALGAFAEMTGLDVEADGWDTAISDLLADLHHLVDRRDVSWLGVLGRADGHYTEETHA